MQNDRSKTLIDSITDSINTLATMTDATAKSDLFKTWLRAVSRSHHYSFNNQLLVLLQRPQAERVAGFHTWKSLGRNVKKGAKGIAILAPCVRKQTAEEADKQPKGERVSEMRLCGLPSLPTSESSSTPTAIWRVGTPPPRASLLPSTSSAMLFTTSSTRWTRRTRNKPKPRSKRSRHSHPPAPIHSGPAGSLIPARIPQWPQCNSLSSMRRLKLPR